jgi:hypothetical protein
MKPHHTIQTGDLQKSGQDPGDQTTPWDRQSQRFLKSIARRALFELSQLKAIPKAPAALDYFYDVISWVFMENDQRSVDA